jgi:hypothetical protein
MSYAMVAAAVIGVVGSVYSANQSSKNAKKALAQQESAQNDARKAAMQQEQAADEANNQANMKSPDTGAMMSAAMMSGKAGVSGTMLTGAQGVDKDKLKTGRSTLLGQ